MQIFEHKQFTQEAIDYMKNYFLSKVKGDKKYFVPLDSGDEVVLDENSLTANNFELFYEIIKGEWFQYKMRGATESDIDDRLDQHLGTPK